MQIHRYVSIVSVLVLLLQTTFVHATTSSCDKRVLLNNLLEERVTKPNIPSIIFRAEDPLGVVYAGAKGQKSFEDNSVVSQNHYFRTASVAKLFTATTVLKLVEEGKLSLDDTIAQYLPDTLVNRLHTNQRQNYGPSITIFQLLSHTSGLSNADENPAFMNAVISNPTEVKTAEELIEYAIEVGAKFPPGEKQSYSSAGYTVLGLVIEAATGKQYHEVVREQILEPLGLQDTFEETHEKPDNIEILSSYLGNVDATQLHPSMEFADGGFITTASDLTKFGLALNNGTVFKSPDTLAMMLQPSGDQSIGLGAFLQLENDQPIYFYHVGFWGSMLYVDIEKQLAITYTLNQAGADSSGFLNDIRQIVNQVEPYYKDAQLHVPCVNIHLTEEQSVAYDIKMQLKSVPAAVEFSLTEIKEK